MRLLTVLLAVALAAAACGGDDEPVAAGDGPGGVPLADEYVSVEVTERGDPRPLVAGTEIRLTFDGERIGATLGCNHLGGRHRIDGTTLVVEELSTTEMGCDPERHAQDEWFAAFLTGRPRLLISGDEIELNDGVTRVVLRDASVTEPDLPLIGTRWEVDGFLQGRGPDGTAMSMPLDRPGTLHLLQGEDVAVGDDGCNEFGHAVGGDALRFEVDGDRLTFTGRPPATQRGCPGADEYVERFWAVLSGTVTWTVDADRLTIVAADGRGVTYRALE